MSLSRESHPATQQWGRRTMQNRAVRILSSWNVSPVWARKCQSGTEHCSLLDVVASLEVTFALFILGLFTFPRDKLRYCLPLLTSKCRPFILSISEFFQEIIRKGGDRGDTGSSPAAVQEQLDVGWGYCPKETLEGKAGAEADFYYIHFTVLHRQN